MLEQTKVINGNFGFVYHEGKHMINVTNIEANINVNYEEVMRSGTRQTGRKAMNYLGEGTLGAYTIGYDFHKAIGSITDDTQGAYVTELHIKLDDPENKDTHEFIVLKGVQFHNIPLGNFEVGSIVEEELQFSFDGYKYI